MSITRLTALLFGMLALFWAGYTEMDSRLIVVVPFVAAIGYVIALLISKIFNAYRKGP